MLKLPFARYSSYLIDTKAFKTFQRKHDMMYVFFIKQSICKVEFFNNKKKKMNHYIAPDKKGYTIYIFPLKFMLWELIRSTNNICFCGDIKKVSIFLGWRKCLNWSYAASMWLF